MKTKNNLDEVNRYIISEMIKDGRVKYTKIAKDLGVTPAAVKERIDRLIKNKIIKPTILINIQELYPVGAAIGIEGDNDTIESLVRKLSNLPNVLRIVRSSGNHNLILSIVAEDFANLEAFINNRIRSEAGIKHVEVNITHSTGPLPDFAYVKLVDEKDSMLERIKKRVKR
jgi:Lrp/AsnC family transcriptional regulator for asnA, asnC and gidA